MVYRIYVEKKKELANEAAALLADIRGLLQIDGVTDLRIINRYDVENIDKELFDYAKGTVFSEPQLDIISDEIELDGDVVFAVEFLPGQFDQRADSAAQCIQIISQGERPTVRTAKVYMLYGKISETEIAEIKKYVINPVESRQATLDTFETLQAEYEIPDSVETLDGFCKLTKSELA
ncbi:MAG: phosphoribosylformylglycinamidine synthase, partial [Clostridia bacterium]|nr:phosphoribosylformylglycinamidine synthase [Clostridia bacterium]